MPARRLLLLTSAVAAGLALTLAACGGDDAQASAQKQVCSARADITKQVNQLQSLTPSTVTVQGVQSNLQAIKKSLQSIGDAQDQLSDERRKEIKAANEAFSKEIRDVGSTVLRSTSVQEAKTKISSAIDQLGTSYRQTLATVNCD